MTKQTTIVVIGSLRVNWQISTSLTACRHFGYYMHALVRLQPSVFRNDTMAFCHDTDQISMQLHMTQRTKKKNKNKNKNTIRPV